MNALVGYTGFVGGNIYSAGEFAGYNSKNIAEAYGTKPDLLIYAGLRAEKYLANNAPEKDYQLILEAEDNIAKISPRKLVLISTIDIFKVPDKVTENSEVDTEGLQAYGKNRYLLEQWVRAEYPEALIIRLPGLFGKGIKKNFIYDFINVIPFMLKEDKFAELAQKDSDLLNYYRRQENGFYKVTVAEAEKGLLKNKFRQLGFSALNFTDSRSVYQFYNLSRLWQDIQLALENDIRLLHMATEPVSAAELFAYLTGEPFDNILSVTPAYYDYRTEYSHIFGGSAGYISDKGTVLAEIKEFVGNEGQLESLL